MVKSPLKRLQPLINQAELARRTQLSERYIGQLMSGVRTTPKRVKQLRDMLLRELSYLQTIQVIE
ncbi:MAG: helix-turn-helix domain-containing protein [Bacteroidetes bacterium]|nr:MAG: helix-turn-helix domain-containing protein [Bacteroidota bacterium]